MFVKQTVVCVTPAASTRLRQAWKAFASGSKPATRHTAGSGPTASRRTALLAIPPSDVGESLQLSIGIHGWSDKDCLSRATAIRVVLTELAGRLNALLYEKSELDEAVSILLNLKDSDTKE